MYSGLEVTGRNSKKEISYKIEVNRILNTFNLYDLIWILEIAIEIEHKYGKISNNTEDMLNNISDIKEIKNLILGFSEKYRTRDFEEFKDLIQNYQTKNRIRGIDFVLYKENPRLLKFSLNYITSQERLKIFKIRNDFINFLYLSYVYLDEDISEKLDQIKKYFSEIVTKHNTHFKNKNDTNFYQWAFKYMVNNPDYDMNNYSPINESDFEYCVESYFDYLCYKNIDRYENYKKRLNGAWSQKKHNEKYKGKKEYLYILSKKAKEELEKLCFINQCKEEEMLEKLISERFVKDYKNALGDDRY